MKKLLLLVLSLCAIVNNSYGFGDYKTVTLKVGESYSLTAIDFNTAQTHMVSGESIVVSYESNSPMDYTIYAVKSGTAFFSYYDKCVLFKVVDVIPKNKEIIVGEQFKFSPNISSGKSLTWNSSNSSVASISSDGVVKGISPGLATITCSNADGIDFSCNVSVDTRLISSISLNQHNCQLNINDNLQLVPSIFPNNATNTQVKWLSSNDNIAQVDDNGNVTAIGAGYCSIYAKADDGSGKFDKCLIHVTGTAGSRSDVNGDGVVTVTDAEVVIEEILSQP